MKDTLASWFRNEETPYLIVFFDKWDYWTRVPFDHIDPCHFGKLMAFDSEAARSILSVEFDNSFGSQAHPNFTAWSKTKVYSVYQYDGRTSLSSEYRSPEDFAEAQKENQE
jgi:hypothetical protein